MLWKNLAVLIGFAWLTSTFAAAPVASENMDDALGHKIARPAAKKTSKRGVANEDARQVPSEKDGASDPQYWNWENAEVEQTAEQFEPSVEDESEY